MFSVDSVLQKLQEQAPVALKDLPNEHGVYALVDHTGAIRYIGVTESPAMGFWRRIYQYHVTGSEGRSHKFSQAYNTGRMWRSRKAGAEQLEGNAKLAKALRTRFCRTYCKAAYVAIPSDTSSGSFFQYLTRLEGQIQQIAPSSMRAWEGIGFVSVDEPVKLVEELIARAGFNEIEIGGLEAQSRLYSRQLLASGLSQ